MARVAINPAVLEWALRDSGRTADDLKTITKRSSQEVQEWISGKRAPHLGDLKAIGSLLGRSPFFFSLPNPPTGRTYSGQFRTAIGSEIGTDERAVEIAALRWGQRLQRLATQFVSVDEFKIPFSADREASLVAQDARLWLHWDSRAQFTATSKSASFKRLRAAVEEQQIVVTIASAGTSRFCGFSLPDRSLPTIYINKDYDLASVRSYTLMHELAHIIRSQRRVCYGGDVGAERWCNQFAAAFLMPPGEVRTYFTKSNLSFTSLSDTDPVRRVANRFKTSWLATAIRLEELNLAPLGIADFVRNTRPEPKEGGFNPEGGRRTPEIRVDTFGLTFVRTISTAIDTGQLSSLDARRILSVDGPQLAETRAIADSSNG